MGYRVLASRCGLSCSGYWTAQTSWYETWQWLWSVVLHLRDVRCCRVMSLRGCDYITLVRCCRRLFMRRRSSVVRWLGNSYSRRALALSLLSFCRWLTLSQFFMAIENAIDPLSMSIGISTIWHMGQLRCSTLRHVAVLPPWLLSAKIMALFILCLDKSVVFRICSKWPSNCLLVA